MRLKPKKSKNIQTLTTLLQTFSNHVQLSKNFFESVPVTHKNKDFKGEM